MSFEDLVTAAQKYFPNLKVKYKDESPFMKLLGKVLFFNPGFMTSYTTTIGDTVYFPTRSFVETRQTSAAVILLHELVHIKDSQKLSKPLFSFLYLTPQILILLCIPLLLLSWKIFLPLLIIFALPLPSYFRMYFEKRAYFSSLYSLNSLGNRLKFPPLLISQEALFLQQFKDSSYYYMWPFSNIQKEFADAVDKIKAGQRPFEDPVFDILDDLLTVV